MTHSCRRTTGMSHSRHRNSGRRADDFAGTLGSLTSQRNAKQEIEVKFFTEGLLAAMEFEELPC